MNGKREAGSYVEEAVELAEKAERGESVLHRSGFQVVQTARSRMALEMGIFSRFHPLVAMGWKRWRHRISYSSVQDFNTCQRMFFWKHVLRLNRSFLPSKAALIGVLFHKLIENLTLKVRGGTRGTPNLEEMLKQANFAAAEFLQERMREVRTNTGVLADWIVEEATREAQFAAAMVTGTWEDLERSKIVDLLADPEAELMTECLMGVRAGKLAGTIFGVAHGMEFIVRPDLVIRRKEGDVVLDFKTTSNSVEDFASVLLMDPQAWLYRLVMEALGYKVTEIRFVIVRKPTIRASSKETWRDFLERVVQWYRTKQEFEKVAVVRADPDYVNSTEWARWIGKVARFMNSRSLRLSDFPRTGVPKACLSVYGSRCPFYELCQAPPGALVDLIPAMYVQTEPKGVEDGDGD